LINPACQPKCAQRSARSAAGGGPERQRGGAVNPLAYAFVGSSPTSPTNQNSDDRGRMTDLGADVRLLSSERGCSSMVEQQPSKLMTRVRFPSPAPISRPREVTTLERR